MISGVVEYLDIGRDRTRVAMTSFRDDITHRFDFDKYKNSGDLSDAIRNEPYKRDRGRERRRGGRPRRETCTWKGIEHATKMFQQDARPMASGVTRVAIVVTDGASSDTPRTARAATELKRQGVTVFVLGLGKSLNPCELRQIVTLPVAEHMHLLDEVNEVDSATMIQKVTEWAMCPDPVTPPVPPPPVARPTPRPTNRPTNRPTTPPVPDPTTRPTRFPTANPTPQPTRYEPQPLCGGGSNEFEPGICGDRITAGDCASLDPSIADYAHTMCPRLCGERCTTQTTTTTTTTTLVTTALCEGGALFNFDEPRSAARVTQGLQRPEAQSAEACASACLADYPQCESFEFDTKTNRCSFVEFLPVRKPLHFLLPMMS